MHDWFGPSLPNQVPFAIAPPPVRRLHCPPVQVLEKTYHMLPEDDGVLERAEGTKIEWNAGEGGIWIGQGSTVVGERGGAGVTVLAAGPTPWRLLSPPLSCSAAQART